MPTIDASDEVQILSCRRAAVRLGVSFSTIRNLIACGDLAAIRIGRRVLIRETELQRFLQSRPAATHPKQAPGR